MSVRAAFAGIAAALWLCATPAAAADLPEPSGTVKNFALSASRTAPALDWTGPDGTPVSLASFAGKVALINVWATWCAPCVKELPSLQRLQTSMAGKDLIVVALSIDRGEVGGAKARDMLRRLRLDHLAFHHDPDGTALRSLGIDVMPTTIVFDRHGRELGRLKGPAEWDAPEAQALLDTFIGAQ
jgi:thiol-disulfide isomerase/thioredoxin